MYFDLMCPSLPGLCCNGSTQKKEYGEQFLKNIFAPYSSKLARQCKMGKGTVAFKYHTYILQYWVLVSCLEMLHIPSRIVGHIIFCLGMQFQLTLPQGQHVCANEVFISEECMFCIITEHLLMYM